MLERVRRAGINTITLAASYHAGKFVRPHGRTGKVYFPKDGTVYFKARPERYGHIKPLVNPLVEEFDGFAELQEAAPDLERCAWVVCLHNTPLGMQHPELTSRNAFGDPYPYSLCPAHPAVRDYVVNLCADLVDRYDIDRVVLETPGWLPYDHGYHHEFALLPLDRYAKTLLALCFSDATKRAAEAADIDAERLQARARAMLERWFAADLAVPEAMATAWWESEIVADPEWARIPALALPPGRRPGRRGQGRAAGRHAPCRDPDRAAAERCLLARGQRLSPCWRMPPMRSRCRPTSRAPRRCSRCLARARPGRRDAPPPLHPAAELPRSRGWRRDHRRGAPAEGGRALPALPSTTTATSALPASRTSRARSRC